MRDRVSIFVLGVVAVVALLLALSRHQAYLTENSGLEQAKKDLSGLKAKFDEADKQGKAAAQKVTELSAESEKTKAALAETTKQAQAAAQKVAEQEKELEKLRPPPPAPPAPPPEPPNPVIVKIEALQKDLAAKDQALQGLVGKLQSKLDETSGGLGDIKKELVTPGTGVLARLEEVAKFKETATQLSQQVAGIEAKLAAQEKLLAAEKDRYTGEIRRQEAALDELKKTLEDVRKLGPEPISPKPEMKPAPSVATTVQASTSTVVVLGAGKKQGLEVGDVLHVSRDGKPVGRVKVIKLFDDLAGAEILETASGESIQKNDQATTQAPLSPPKAPPAAGTAAAGTAAPGTGPAGAASASPAGAQASPPPPPPAPAKVPATGPATSPPAGPATGPTPAAAPPSAPEAKGAPSSSPPPPAAPPPPPAAAGAQPQAGDEKTPPPPKQ